jgi:transposase-like protein
MAKKHRTFSSEFKAQAVLAVISGSKTAAELCREQQLKPDLFSKWKAAFLSNAAQVFERETPVEPQQARIAELEQLVGRLTLELEVAKKASKLLRPTTHNADQ